MNSIEKKWFLNHGHVSSPIFVIMFVSLEKKKRHFEIICFLGMKTQNQKAHNIFSGGHVTFYFLWKNTKILLMDIYVEWNVKDSFFMLISVCRDTWKVILEQYFFRASKDKTLFVHPINAFSLMYSKQWV